MSKRSYPSGAEKRKRKSDEQAVISSVPKLTTFFAPVAVGQDTEPGDVVEQQHNPSASTSRIADVVSIDG